MKYGMRNARIQNIKCLFGIHEYEIPDKDDPEILICKHCKKSGYYKYSNGFETWYDYDKNGNAIRFKDSNGYNEWLHEGEWTNIKPENWEYEKEI